MAIVVLFFRGHLCKTSGIPVRDEDGVITETVFACQTLTDAAFADAFEEVFFFFPDQGDDGAKAGLTVNGFAEPVQQFSDIGSSWSLFSCLVWAAHPRVSVSGG